MNICSQETENAMKKLTFKFFASKDLYLFMHAISTTGQRLHLHFLDTHRAHLSCPPETAASQFCAEVTRVRITAHDSTFLFQDVLNHFQLPKRVTCLTDGFKALSSMVHYQNLVNRNRLFSPACEDAAEHLISGKADYNYDSAIL